MGNCDLEVLARQWDFGNISDVMGLQLQNKIEGNGINNAESDVAHLDDTFTSF